MSTINYRLTAADRPVMDALLASARTSGRDAPVEERLREVALLAHEAPVPLRRALLDFRAREPAGHMIVSGLPIDDAAVGPTPDHWRHAVGGWTREDVFVLMVASLLGEPFAWSTQQDGRFVHNVMPIKEHADEQLGSGTRQTLWWHTEDAFHEARPDYLLLLCLRNPDRVATTFADISEIEVDQASYALLSESRYQIRPDNSHKPEHNSAERADPDGQASGAFTSIAQRDTDPRQIPVMFGDLAEPYIRLDPFFMSPSPSAPHAEAFAWLRRQIDENLERIVLEPGDCLIIDNYRAVHGRDAYEARYDGTDRWLKRVNVARDLRPSRVLRRGAGSSTIYG
jgi:enduracididine beta-hydroxylase